MQKSDLLRAIQQEILRHDFPYFVDEPQSTAQGGKGVVVPGRTPSMGAQCFKLMKGLGQIPLCTRCPIVTILAPRIPLCPMSMARLSLAFRLGKK